MRQRSECGIIFNVVKGIANEFGRGKEGKCTRLNSIVGGSIFFFSFLKNFGRDYASFRYYFYRLSRDDPRRERRGYRIIFNIVKANEGKEGRSMFSFLFLKNFARYYFYRLSRNDPFTRSGKNFDYEKGEGCEK